MAAFRALLVDMEHFAPPDDSAKFHFIEGLAQEVRTQLMIHDPATLDDAMRTAERIGESTHASRVSTKTRPSTTSGQSRSTWASSKPAP